MTHEYVIALGGVIAVSGPELSGEPATAIAWAAESVLAVGSDETVRSISRGDSTFFELDGCLVTAGPTEARLAERIAAAARHVDGLDIPGLLIEAGLLDADVRLEPGSPADLAFWRRARDGGDTVNAPFHLMAELRGGVFIDGDARQGPFHLIEQP